MILIILIMITIISFYFLFWVNEEKKRKRKRATHFWLFQEKPKNPSSQKKSLVHVARGWMTSSSHSIALQQAYSVDNPAFLALPWDDFESVFLSFVLAFFPIGDKGYCKKKNKKIRNRRALNGWQQMGEPKLWLSFNGGKPPCGPSLGSFSEKIQGPLRVLRLGRVDHFLDKPVCVCVMKAWCGGDIRRELRLPHWMLPPIEGSLALIFNIGLSWCSFPPIGAFLVIASSRRE